MFVCVCVCICVHVHALQLSIGQKVGSEQSASLDNIYIAAGGGDGGGGKGDATGDKLRVIVIGATRRRTSEPNAPVIGEGRQKGSMLDDVIELEASLNGGLSASRPYPVLGTSCSAEGIAQLVEGDWPDERCVLCVCALCCVCTVCMWVLCAVCVCGCSVLCVYVGALCCVCMWVLCAVCVLCVCVGALCCVCTVCMWVLCVCGCSVLCVYCVYVGAACVWVLCAVCVLCVCGCSVLCVYCVYVGAVCVSLWCVLHLIVYFERQLPLKSATEGSVQDEFKSNTLVKQSKRVRSKSVEHPTTPRKQQSTTNLDPDVLNPAF